MKRKHKINPPKGKMTNVDFEDSIRMVDVEHINGQQYDPKDGDIVYIRNEFEHIIIFKEIEREDICAYVESGINLNPILEEYIYPTLTIAKLMPLRICSIKGVKEIRPATEKEKEFLIDKLSQAGKRWNEATRTIENARWRAKVGERFYYIDTEFFINSMVRCEFHSFWKKYDSLEERLKDERFNNVEYMLWKKGNYFKTHETAEKVVEQIREIFKKSKAE